MLSITSPEESSNSPVSYFQLAAGNEQENSPMSDVFNKTGGLSKSQSKTIRPTIAKRGVKKNACRWSVAIPEVTQFKAHPDPSNPGSTRIMYTCPVTNETLFFKYQYTTKTKGVSFKCEGCLYAGKHRTIHVTIRHDYFLTDPFAMEHVCDTGTRTKSRPQPIPASSTPSATSVQKKLAPCQEIRALFSPLFDENTTSTSQECTCADDLAPATRGVDIRDWRESKPRPPPLSRFVPTPVAMKMNTKSRQKETVAEESVTNHEVPPSTSTVTSVSGPQPAAKSRHASYLSLVELALDGLDPAFELQYQSDLMRFIYSDLQRKYGLSVDALV